MVESIEHEGNLLAILIRKSFRAEGIEFFTPNELSQQVAYMNHPADYEIQSHVHNAVLREVKLTQEVLVIRSGKVRVDIYTESREYLESRILEEGDVILLVAGGHGFQMLEASEIIEVKQGPYAGDLDKTRFESVSPNSLIVK